MKKKPIIVIISVAIVLIIVSAGIILVIKNRNDNINPDTQSNSSNNRLNGQGRATLSALKGSVFSTNNNTVIIDTDNNQGQKIVILSDTTTINKSIDASKNDLVVGQSITLNGELKDTTIKAKTITIVPTRNRRSSSNQSQSENSSGASSLPNNINPNAPPQEFQQGGASGQGGAGVPQNLFDKNTFNGKILTISDNLITGSFNNIEYNVNLDSTTTFKKQVTGTKDEVKKGINVLIFGRIDSSGTVTARNISIL